MEFMDIPVAFLFTDAKLGERRQVELNSIHDAVRIGFAEFKKMELVISSGPTNVHCCSRLYCRANVHLGVIHGD